MIFLQGESDLGSFYLEICAFLKEMYCPYSCLNQGPIDERFRTKENRLKLIDFLLSEFQSALLISANKPETIQTSTNQFSVK